MGAGRSILVDKSGRIIAGNKTFEAWQALGGSLETIHTAGDTLIVVQRDDLDLDEPDGLARQLAYYDNRVNETNLAWDVDQILQDLDTLSSLEKFWTPAELDAFTRQAAAGVYTPNLSPAIGPGTVTEQDVFKTQETFPGKVQGSQQSLVDITCPHCLETFSMQRDSLTHD